MAEIRPINMRVEVDAEAAANLDKAVKDFQESVRAVEDNVAKVWQAMNTLSYSFTVKRDDG